jgi:hypothetical protein
MATVVYWIQSENHPWGACPNNVDRMSGLDLKAITRKDKVDVTLNSPGTGVSSTRAMFAPPTEELGIRVCTTVASRSTTCSCRLAPSRTFAVFTADQAANECTAR